MKASVREDNVWERCCRPFDALESEQGYVDTDWGFPGLREAQRLVYFSAGESGGIELLARDFARQSP